MKMDITTEDNFNYININKLLDKIINQEEKKYNLKLKLSLLSFVQYYKSDILKKQFKLAKNFEKLSLLTAPWSFSGVYYKNTQEILIFFNGELVKSNKLPELLHTIFHELFHYYQDTLVTNDFEKFVFLMEKIIMLNEPKHYNSSNYHKYYSEITANLYGIKMAEKYINDDNQINKQYFEYYKNRYNYQLNTFDLDGFFQKFNDAMLIDEYFCEALAELPFLRFFYDENKNFRSIGNILKSLKDSDFDIRITSTIICSDDYLNQLDLNELNDEELVFLTEIIFYKFRYFYEKDYIHNYYLKNSLIYTKHILTNNRQDISSRFNYLRVRIEDFIFEDIIDNKNNLKYIKKLTQLLEILDEIRNKKKSNVYKKQRK